MTLPNSYPTPMYGRSSMLLVYYLSTKFRKPTTTEMQHKLQHLCIVNVPLVFCVISSTLQDLRSFVSRAAATYQLCKGTSSPECLCCEISKFLRSWDLRLYIYIYIHIQTIDLIKLKCVYHLDLCLDSCMVYALDIVVCQDINTILGNSF